MNPMKAIAAAAASALEQVTGEKSRTERQDLELDHASRQIECCRYADAQIQREGRRPRFAIVDHDVFT